MKNDSQQFEVLINEHRVKNLNPLYELAQDITLHNLIATSGFSLLLTRALHTHTHTHIHT